MRLNSKHKHKQTGIIFELITVQKPTRNKSGGMDEWLILKNQAQKYPVSVSRVSFEAEYEPV